MKLLKTKKNKPKKLKERNKFLLFDENWNFIEAIVLNRSYNGNDIREIISKPNTMYLLIAIDNGKSKPKLFSRNKNYIEDSNETS